MVTVNLQSLTSVDSSGKSSSGPVNLKAGESLQGTVKQVSQDQLDPKVFRVKVEADSRLMELQTKQPIAQGSQVTIARDTNGKLTVSIQQPTTSATTSSPQSSNASQATAPTGAKAIVLQAPAILININNGQSPSSQLNQLIPPGTTQLATVLQQAPAVTQNIISNPPATTAGTAVANTLSGTSVPTPNTPATPSASASAIPTQPTASLSVSSTGTTYAASTVPMPQPGTTSTTSQPNLQTTTVSQTSVTTAVPTNTQASQSPSTTPTPNTLPHNPPATSQQLDVSIKGQAIRLETPVSLPPLKEVSIQRGMDNQLKLNWSSGTSSITESAIPKAMKNDALPLTASQIKTIDQTLRETLPIQKPIAEGLQQLSSTLQGTSSNNGIDKALQSILQLFSVTPGGSNAEQSIRQNFQLGGLFTENRLANQQPVTNDMKQFLGKLETLAEQLPPAQRQSVQNAVDSMMSRITQQQISQVQHRQDRTDTTERFYQLDLPVHFQEALDNVEMRIQQRDSQNEHGRWDTLWRVRLHFELGNDGMIDADISLNETTQSISALFACSENNTANRVRGQLDEFSERLTQLGFETTNLTCRQGNIAAQKTAIHKQLIDVKT